MEDDEANEAFNEYLAGGMGGGGYAQFYTIASNNNQRMQMPLFSVVTSGNTAIYPDALGYMSSHGSLTEVQELRETVQVLQREIREIRQILSNAAKQQLEKEHRKLSI